MTALTANLQYLTADLPGMEGRVKVRPTDFLVEEQPADELAGHGEHVYVFIEKRQRTTIDVVRRLGKAFGVQRHDIGYAGLKDKQAITRQQFSIYLPKPGSEEAGLGKLQHHPQLTILWHQRHTQKLRKGHHGGNRFSIRVRKVEPTTAALRAKAILDRLAAQGVPNFIGEQRFGFRQNGYRLGRYLLLGDYQAMLDDMLGGPWGRDSQRLQKARAAYDAGDYRTALEMWPRMLRFDRQALDALRQGKSAKEAALAIDQPQRDFLVNAFQSAIFNQVLNQRLIEGTFDRLVVGDLAWKHDNGAVFAVNEPTAELENGPEGRIRTMAISPSGPMWGVDMIKPKGHPRAMEEAALRQFEITQDELSGDGYHTAFGRRRPMRVPLRDPDVAGGSDEHGPYVKLSFELPRGAFATIVLREIMKHDRVDFDQDNDEGHGGNA